MRILHRFEGPASVNKRGYKKPHLVVDPTYTTVYVPYYTLQILMFIWPAGEGVGGPQKSYEPAEAWEGEPGLPNKT